MTRGGLLRLRLARMKRAKEAGKKKLEVQLLMREAGRKAQAAYISRVGIRPTPGSGDPPQIGSDDDQQLTEHNYTRLYSAVVIQAHARGWFGRVRRPLVLCDM